MRIDHEGWNPPHVSHSTIDGYATCGMRTKLQKVLHKEQRPGLAATGGNAVHTATELSDRYELGGFDPEMEGDPTNPKDLFLEGWRQALEKNKEYSPSYTVDQYTLTGRASAAYGGKRNIDWWMDNGPVMVQSWIDWRLQHQDWHIWEDPDGVPGIELEFLVTLPNGIAVKGFIDRAMVTPAGQLAPLDIKTGRTPETAEQLGLYATFLELTHGQMFRPDWGYWWDAQKGSHSTPMALSDYTVEYFEERYSSAIAGMNAGCFLAKPANNCRNWCGVAQFCPAVGGSLSA
jgi:hypothetical protein